MVVHVNCNNSCETLLADALLSYVTYQEETSAVGKPAWESPSSHDSSIKHRIWAMEEERERNGITRSPAGIYLLYLIATAISVLISPSTVFSQLHGTGLRK